VPDTLSPSPPSRRLHLLAVSTLSPSPPSRRLHPLAVSTLSPSPPSRRQLRSAAAWPAAGDPPGPWPLAAWPAAKDSRPGCSPARGAEKGSRSKTGPPRVPRRRALVARPPTTRVLRPPRAVLLVADRPAAALVLGTHPRASPASPASCPSPVSRTRRRATPSPRRLVGRRRLSTPSRRRLSTPSRRRLSTHPRWGHLPILPHPQAHPGPSPVPRVTPRACTPTPRQSRRGDASTAACSYYSIL
jgi:hypothetical protein